MTQTIIKGETLYGAFTDGEEVVMATGTSIAEALQIFAEYQDEDGTYDVIVAEASLIDATNHLPDIVRLVEDMEESIYSNECAFDDNFITLKKGAKAKYEKLMSEMVAECFDVRPYYTFRGWSKTFSANIKEGEVTNLDALTSGEDNVRHS